MFSVVFIGRRGKLRSVGFYMAFFLFFEYFREGYQDSRLLHVAELVVDRRAEIVGESPM